MPLPPHCWSWLGRSAGIFGHCLVRNDTTVHSCWVSKPTWNGSYFPSRHIKEDWKSSYAFDGNMDPSSCRYHHTCWSWLERSDGVFGHCWARNDTAIYCGWGSQSTWGMVPTSTQSIKKLIDINILHAVDGDMDLSSCRYLNSYWAWYGKSTETFGICWTPNDTVRKWLRL